MKILSYLVEESPVSDLHTHFYINVERTTFISFLGVTLILSMNMNILDIIININVKTIRHHDQDHYIRFYIVCKQIWRNKTDLHSVIAHLFKTNQIPYTTTRKTNRRRSLFNRLPFSFSVNQSQNHYLATSSSDMCQLQQVKLITGISVSELSTNKKNLFSLWTETSLAQNKSHPSSTWGNTTFFSY